MTSQTDLPTLPDKYAYAAMNSSEIVASWRLIRQHFENNTISEEDFDLRANILIAAQEVIEYQETLTGYQQRMKELQSRLGTLLPPRWRKTHDEAPAASLHQGDVVMNDWSGRHLTVERLDSDAKGNGLQIVCTRADGTKEVLSGNTDSMIRVISRA